MGWKFWKKEKVTEVGVSGKPFIINPSKNKQEMRNLVRYKKCEEKLKTLKKGTKEYLSFEAEYYKRKAAIKQIELGRAN